MPEEKAVAEKMHVRCKTIIEILGKPKEHVEETLKMYINKIKADSELIVLKTEFADATEKDDLWATFAELEMIVKGIPKLIAFCFDYMPSSIEIIKPEDFSLKKSSIENFLNDLQARLHHVDMVIKNQKNENNFLRKNMNTAISNVILICLASSDLDKEQLSKITGVHDKELGLFLDKLVEEKKIIKKDKVYSLAK